jgi:DNA-binding NtrC family response regulator
MGKTVKDFSRKQIAMIAKQYVESSSPHAHTKISEEQGNAKKTFSKEAIKLLQEYDWTGNIRELRNVVERLIILGGNEISEQDVKLFASK